MAPAPLSPTSPTSPTSTPKQTRLSTMKPSSVPPPVPVETHPNRGQFKPPLHRQAQDPTRLAPEDAYKTFSPPRLRPLTEITGLKSAAATAAAAALRPAVASLRAPPAIPPVAARLEQERKRRSASRRRKQPHQWKKLLWIKQHGFPDNYTDTEKFLDHLQRPDLRPYEFWPLVADSTVIVQHICSVAVFICAYAGIYQGRLSPVAVVTCGSIATIFGWVLWDYWMSQGEADDLAVHKAAKRVSGLSVESGSSNTSGVSGMKTHVNGYANGHAVEMASGKGLGLTLSTTNLLAKDHEEKSKSKHGPSTSRMSFHSISPIERLSQLSAADTLSDPKTPNSHHSSPIALPFSSSSVLTLRIQARLKTFKSALLIYCALLGLSPILKSLTKSTSSDSIWALATWLLIINIFFFDYGSLYVPGKNRTVLSSTPSTAVPVDPSLTPVNSALRAPPFPSSLSTNAALMASTVLASRLLTTTAVFSLTLFSIQVFGLFPVFRRHLRQESRNGHLLLSVVLVSMSSSGLGLILSQSYTHTYGDCGFCWGWLWHVLWRSLVGLVVGGLSTMFVMGGCSWWLIGLQRYKNVVMGPWDPARPVLAGGIHGRNRGGTD